MPILPITISENRRIRTLRNTEALASLECSRKTLQTPLLIHTNTKDVNVLEVEHLIKSLKAEGKKFKYEIYKEAPGGNSFNRIDSYGTKESRMKIYDFLAQYLKPNRKFKDVKALIERTVQSKVGRFQKSSGPKI